MPRDTAPKAVQPGMVVMLRRDANVTGARRVFGKRMREKHLNTGSK